MLETVSIMLVTTITRIADAYIRAVDKIFNFSAQEFFVVIDT